MKAWVDKSLCQGCGECMALCAAIGFVDGKAGIISARCTGCGKCIDTCPNGAILVKHEKDGQ